MKYIYPAIFLQTEDGGYHVEFPDIENCFTCGDNLIEATEMAEDVLAMMLWESEKNKNPIPVPSRTLPHEPPQFVSFIKADTELYRRQMDNRAVRKTLTLPAWLNHRAEEAHINFSSVLQEALKEYLHIAD